MFFTAVPIFMFVFMILFFVILIFIIFKNVSIGLKNNRSPTLTVNAKVMAKRTQYNSHHHMNNTGTGTGFSHSGYNSYYITFQVDSGDRLELKIDSSEYGYIIEGDIGKLSFKGTRYISFERENS
jgi:hypothetical protein